MATKKQKLDDAQGTESTKRPRKRVKVKTGQIVAIPLRDGSFGLAHVAHYHGNAVTAHFAHRADSPEKLLEGVENAMENRLLAILDVTSNRISDGYWPVIGYRERAYPATMLDMKGTSYTGNMSEWFFDAYYGLVPWDGMHDPRYYEKQMLQGVPVPPTVRYKKDFAREAQATGAATTRTATRTEDTAPAITEGPGVIHIEIKYPGDDLPTIALLKRRQAIENGLEAAGAGEVIDAGGGGGVMDIYLETTDVAHALPFVHAAIKEAGFENDARIEVGPVSEDEDDPEDEDDN